ncbi:AAA family ATPase [Xanthocytophaga agilis]|uniref:AAA family ATPase n=1 Tax=Xanthocytophaga agilis TaxID=3048010 RepID=A0AAE3R2H7_9BACT|nr:AAA family ATPase [Xanthocytophaga agilis]MDJ1499673.1 AAA family ATPase [Xanthocytophaga agilis]
MDNTEMRKVVIVGCGGAGKSTLARQLGQIIQIPIIHLDAEFWQSDCKMLSREEEAQRLTHILIKDQWIIDGNYSSTMAVRFQVADTIIFLEFSTILCLWRVIKRFFHYWGSTWPDMAEGCPEKLDWEFLMLILYYKYTNRPKVIKHITEFAIHCRVLVFHKHKQVRQFLAALAK